MTAPRPWPTRRHALQAVGLLTAAATGVARAAPAKVLPASQSLRAELSRALALGQPLVVMVSLHGCPWCKLVREHYLAPMRAEEGLQVVQIDLQSPQRTETPDGQPTTHHALARAWGVRVAPTVLFLGPKGREVAARLEGGSPDFYAGYLEQRLADARRGLSTGGA